MTKRHSGEGTVRQRDNGRWEARLRYEDPATGERRRASFYGRTAKEARAAMKAAVERIEAGSPVRDASATLSDVLRDWRTKTLLASSRRQTTKDLYGGLLKSRVESSSIATKRLDRIRASDIDALVIELRQKTKVVSGKTVRALSESTIEKVIRVLRLALAGAVRDQLIARNPVDAAERPSAPRTEVSHLPSADVAKVLGAARNTRYFPILALIAATGLRKGEALALRWPDIDFDKGVLHVRGTLARIDGRLVVMETKTEKSRRRIPLRGPAETLLREHRRAQLEERLRAANVWADTGHVFTTETGQPMDPRNVLRAITTAAGKVGISGVNVHTLRHSAATHWLENGVHLRAVSDLLGHSSTRITGDVYAHTSDEAANRAMDVLGAALGV
jgi:integrase